MNKYIKQNNKFIETESNLSWADSMHDFDKDFRTFIEKRENKEYYNDALPTSGDIPKNIWTEKQCLEEICDLFTSDINVDDQKIYENFSIKNKNSDFEYHKYDAYVVKVTPEDLFTNNPVEEPGKIENNSVLVVDFAQHHFFEKIKKDTWNKAYGGTNPTIYFAMVPEVLNDPALKTNIYTNKEIKKDTGINVIPILDITPGAQEYFPLKNETKFNDNNKKDLFFSKYTFTLPPIEGIINNKKKYTKLKGEIKVSSPSNESLTFSNTTSINQNSIAKILDRIKNFFKVMNTPKDRFETICGFQRKRAGDWLQVLACFDIHTRNFINTKDKDGKLYTNHPINNKELGKVYFQTHDQIACAYALLMGANVIFHAPMTYYDKKKKDDYKTHVMIFKNQNSKSDKLSNDIYIGGKQSVPRVLKQPVVQSGGGGLVSRLSNAFWYNPYTEEVKKLIDSGELQILKTLTKKNKYNDDKLEEKEEKILKEFVNKYRVDKSYYEKDDFFNLLDIFSEYNNLENDYINIFLDSLMEKEKNMFLYYILSSFITLKYNPKDNIDNTGDDDNITEIFKNSENIKLLEWLYNGLSFYLKKNLDDKEKKKKNLTTRIESLNRLRIQIGNREVTVINGQREIEGYEIQIQELINKKKNILYPILTTLYFMTLKNPNNIKIQLSTIIQTINDNIFEKCDGAYKEDEEDESHVGGGLIENNTSRKNNCSNDIFQGVLNNKKKNGGGRENRTKRRKRINTEKKKLNEQFYNKNITKREHLIHIQFLVNIKTHIRRDMTLTSKKLNNIKNFLLYSHFFYDEFKDDENAATISLISAHIEEAIGGQIIFPKKEDESDIFTYEDAKSVMDIFKPDTELSYTIGDLYHMVKEKIEFSFFSEVEPVVDTKTLEEEETSVGETPLGETSVGETPLGETSVVETPLVETSVGETSVGETPLGETPLGETPLVETSVGETPLGETPLGETSVGETSVGRKNGNPLFIPPQVKKHTRNLFRPRSFRKPGGGSKKRKYTKKHKKIRKHKHTRKHKPYKKTKHTRKNKTHKKNKQMSRRR